MARTPLSFEDYFENAFTDAARSGWAEDYDNNFDLFDGKTFTIGPASADYLTVDAAITAAPAGDHVLFLLQTGTHAGLVSSTTVSNKKIVFAPLSGVYGDVVFVDDWINMTVTNTTIVFDKIKFNVSASYNGSHQFYNSTSGAFSRVLFSGCNITGLWNVNTAAKLLSVGVSQGSTDATGVFLSRFTFLACTGNSSRSATGVEASTISAGNYKYEFRRTVYNQATIKDPQSSYAPAFDIEDLSVTETSTHGADAALSVLPLPPQTLAYALDSGLQFSNLFAQADLSTQLSEIMIVGDTHFSEWFREFGDTIRITDGLGILEVFYEKFNTVSFSNSSKLVIQAITEALSFTILFKGVQSFSLREVANLTQTEITKLTTAKIILDSLDVGGDLFVQFVENIIESFQTDETVQTIPKRILAIYESMGISSSPQYAAVFARSITETINILDGLAYAKGATVSENISFSITALKIVLGSILTDICQVTATDTNVLTIVAVHSESLNVSDILNLQSILNGDIADNVVFSIGVPLESDQYATYVINTETLGLSEYTNFPFNSISGEFAATETGIYKLTGNTDDGDAIVSSIKTGLMDFGSNMQKQIPYAYIGCHTDGRMVLKVSNTYKGKKKEYWYKMNQTRQSVDTVRIQLGRGIKATYYQFELVAMDGADFNIDRIELLPLTLKRRI